MDKPRQSVLVAAAFLPAVLLLVPLIRLEFAFAQPAALFDPVPGAPWLRGAAGTVGHHWLSWVLYSGNSLVLSWGFWLLFLVRPPVPAGTTGQGLPWSISLATHSPPVRKVLAITAGTFLVVTAWALGLVNGTREDELIGIFLVAFLPCLVVTYGLALAALRHLESAVSAGALLFGFAGLQAACQFQFEGTGSRGLDERVLVFGSVAVAAAVGVWLWLSERRHGCRSAIP